MLPVKGYELAKICLILENGEIKAYQWKLNHQTQRIGKLCSKVVKVLSAKMWNFVFLARRKITDTCLLFFFQGWSYRPYSPRILERAHSQMSKKVRGQLSPLPCSFFPRNLLIKFFKFFSFIEFIKKNSLHFLQFAVNWYIHSFILF